MVEDEQQTAIPDLGEQTYHTLFDLANDGLVIIDPEGVIQVVNRTACERLGYTREALIGEHVSRLYTPEFAALAPERIQEVLSEGCAVFEAVNQCMDGTTLPVEVNARLIELDGERRIISVVRDISKRKSAEEGFELTQAAVERSSDAVFWKDLNGRIFKVNDQACRNLGYTREELVGMHVWDLDPHVTEAAWPEIMGSLCKQKSAHIETVHRRKDGTTFPVEVIANYVRYRDKEYNISFVRDISDRKWSEAALRDSEERLRQAIRVSQTGIFDHDHVTDTIYWSPEHRDIYGVGMDEDITLPGFIARLYPGDRDMIAAAVRHAHDPEGDGLFDVEFRIVRPDGEVRWVMTRSQTLFEWDGETSRPVRTVGAAMDITERMRTEEKVAYLAFYDSLTGLANRRLLHDRLERALAVSARNHLYGALLFIDLDHFKTINDTVGHEYGDLLLKEVAQRLGAVLREADTISRPGGDEFVVILEEIGADRTQAASQAKVTSDKILRALAEHYQLCEREYIGSASIGVVLFRGHEDNVDELLKRSDMAMYEAKRAGRGVTRFFDPLMQAAFERRAEIEADVRKAIDLEQLMLYYQVRVGRGGQPLGAEALLRWAHPERGLVLPGEFIPVCEETGLILPIGEWVLESACAQLRAWESHPDTRALKVSVNISANQFRQDNFVNQVVRIVEKTGINPARLELELTESMFLENIEQSIAKMRGLREVGVLFALDDFGTGYSSLSYLKKLPLSQIKIDRSFVRDIAVDKNDEIIIQTIIKMGQTLGLEVIAEGVETEEQRCMLEHYGCENFQGYLFGKPLPVAEFEETLAAAAEVI
jgi:diguanylate cyclase (GGDEF)-like protein/PAS domain S-box-containing protein